MKIPSILLALSLFFSPLWSQSNAPSTHLRTGDMAPDFELLDQNGKPVKLSDFRGQRNVVLAFYVLAFTSG